MSAPRDFRLQVGEDTSPIWLRLRAYLEHRLERAREQNDNPASAEQTATLRGEIKALKGLLALGRPRSPVSEDTDVM